MGNPKAARPLRAAPAEPPAPEIRDRSEAAAELEAARVAEAAAEIEAARLERAEAAANSNPFKVFAGLAAFLYFGTSSISNSVNGHMVEGAFDAWIAILGAGFAAAGFGAFDAARKILGRTLGVGAVSLGAILLLSGAYFSYVGIGGGDRAFYLVLGSAAGGFGAVSLFAGISGLRRPDDATAESAPDEDA